MVKSTMNLNKLDAAELIITGNTDTSTRYKINSDSEFPRAVPGDLELLRPWFDLIRHARSKSCSGGYSAVSLRIIVNEHGMPEFWTEPIVNKLSPLAKIDKTRAILSCLTGTTEGIA